MVRPLLGGVRWTFLGYATNRLVTFAATVVLARLLVPGDFGLIALATSVTTLVGLFSGLGLGVLLGGVAHRPASIMPAPRVAIGVH